MGERTPLALLDAAASARMAVAEALTNILAADIGALGDVRLSANWMAACGEPGEDADLYAAVRAVGEELCPALGIAIPVGKDSLSMRTAWREGDARAQGGRAGVADRLRLRAGARRAPHADAAAADWRRADHAAAGRSGHGPQSAGRQRAGAGVCGRRRRSGRPRRCGRGCAASPRFMAELRGRDLALAYHDRSDGGLSRDAGRDGLRRPLRAAQSSWMRRAAARWSSCSARSAARCCRCATRRLHEVWQLLGEQQLADCARVIGAPQPRAAPCRSRSGATELREPLRELRAAWSATSHQMRRLRDDPDCADEEYAAQLDDVGSRAAVAAALRSGRGRRRAVHRAAARGRAWPCCASRASTARWRWRRRSSAPASRPSTCT